LKNFHSLCGYVMKDDKPLVWFQYEAGTLVQVKIIADRDDLPIEYKCKVSDLRATELFMDDRVIPASRQRLMPELEKIGINYYDPEQLIRYNKGVSVEDHYWIDVQNNNNRIG